jgi:hypothetical protein
LYLRRGEEVEGDAAVGRRSMWDLSAGIAKEMPAGTQSERLGLAVTPGEPVKSSEKESRGGGSPVKLGERADQALKARAGSATVAREQFGPGFGARLAE